MAIRCQAALLVLFVLMLRGELSAQGLDSADCRGDEIPQSWGEVRAEKLTWDERGGLADDLEIFAGTLSLFSKKVSLQLPNSDQNGYRLKFSKGFEFTSQPSSLHAKLPMGPKARWMLKTPHALVKWDGKRKWQSADLFTKLLIEAQLPSDQRVSPADPVLGHQPLLTALRFSAAYCSVTQARQSRFDKWRLWGHFNRADTSLLKEFTCSADQLHVDGRARSLLINPHTTLKLPCGEMHHRGEITLSSAPFDCKALSREDRALRRGKCLVRGSGLTSGELARSPQGQTLVFTWPLGFDFDARDALFRCLGKRGAPLTLKAEEKGRSLHLRAESGQLYKVPTDVAKDSLRAQFIGEVELHCSDADRDFPKKQVQVHQILADRLLCCWPERRLIFDACQNGPVRYFNASKDLRISAPLLQIDCPANESLRIRGQGVVRAKLKAPFDSLRPPPNPLLSNGK